MSKLITSSKRKDKSESETKSIQFSEIIKIEIDKSKNAINFILENGEIISKDIESCQKFIDPSYDSVFKTIFGDGNMIDGVNGNQRLLDLLNSLVFPKEINRRFTEIVSIGNEKGVIKPKNKTNSGIMRFDISCKIKVTDKKVAETKIIDVEMQLGNRIGLLPRLRRYANALHEIYNLNTLLIAFMNQNYINEENKSQYIKETLFNNEGASIRDLDYVQIVMMNLKEQIMNYQNKKGVLFMSKEIDKIGISWLKLLGIRQWSESIDDFYYLPKDVKFPSKELESVFKMLKSYGKAELLELKRIEEENNNILEIYQEKGVKEGIIKGKREYALLALINVFKTKKESFDEMIDAVDYENTVFIKKDIEKYISDNQERKEFINFLQKKRKIE